MAGHVDTVRIAAEALGILIDPRYRSAYLLGHRHEVAVGLYHVDEIGHHVMRPGVHEQLGGGGGVLGQAAAPRAPVNEDVDRRVRAAGWGDVPCPARPPALRLAPSSPHTTTPNL